MKKIDNYACFVGGVIDIQTEGSYKNPDVFIRGTVESVSDEPDKITFHVAGIRMYVAETSEWVNPPSTPKYDFELQREKGEMNHIYIADRPDGAIDIGLPDGCSAVIHSGSAGLSDKPVPALFSLKIAAQQLDDAGIFKKSK